MKIKASAEIKKSARRDSNSTTVKKANKYEEKSTLSVVCLQAVYNFKFWKKAVKGAAKQIHLAPLLLFMCLYLKTKMDLGWIEAYAYNPALFD